MTPGLMQNDKAAIYRHKVWASIELDTSGESWAGKFGFGSQSHGMHNKTTFYGFVRKGGGGQPQSVNWNKKVGVSCFNNF